MGAGKKRRARKRELKLRKSRPRALNAEEITALAFSELVGSGLFDAYVHAKHNDSLDSSHIDFAAVNFSAPKLFVLQTKTRVKRKSGQKFETPAERHLQKYPHIPVNEVKLGGDKRLAIRNVKKKIKELYAQNPSAETVLDREVLSIIASKLRSLGYDNLFF